MNPYLIATAAQQLGVFTASQAMDAGLSDDEIRSKVRSGEWHPIRRGVYLPTDEFAEARRDAVAFHRVLAAAGILALRPGAYLSHTSGVALHGIALLQSPGGTVQATRPSGPPRTYRGLRVHELPIPAAQRTSIGALPTVTAARAVLDCAVDLPFRDAVVTAESALQDHVTLLDLWDAFPALPRRLRRPVERVLHFASTKSESPGESLTRVFFCEHGIPDPDQQVSYSDARGVIGRVDFVWREEGVIAEFDGELKYGSGETVFAEKQREDRLRDLGFEVVRITWGDLTSQPHLLVDRIQDAFRRAANGPRSA